MTDGMFDDIIFWHVAQEMSIRRDCENYCKIMCDYALQDNSHAFFVVTQSSCHA
jgi:hypothetical protein